MLHKHEEHKDVTQTQGQQLSLLHTERHYPQTNLTVSSTLQVSKP